MCNLIAVTFLTAINVKDQENIRKMDFVQVVHE